MSSEQNLECVFCKEAFDDKETLQIHFRKHADPSFNKNARPPSEPAIIKDSSANKFEMVSCDVCTEEFTTISKAITHKHKMHPDHDAKHFCSWCGKLFTMKHLFNKHLTQHESMEKSSEEPFHCDCCDVDFHVPSAMIYHNKYFHRQETELPVIGHSKKQKFVNQELIPLYYCAFCGEEYINKVNLHKHMSDDHGDENQSPDEVFRCPLCQAIFYHLDAYEIHLTFHSIEDIYNGKDMSETASDLTEFTLESVPPSKEKVEEYEPQEEVKGSDDTMDIEQLVKLAMNNDNLDADSEIPTKHKKHKKRKKSKKSAITLDEFLNMNSDVFGEDLDFQGIEVVPTTVVNKRLQAKAKSDIEKLKQQGIVVKVKRANKVNVAPGVKILTGKKKTTGKTTNDSKQEAINTSNTMKGTTNDVLSKLLSQSQNQIKVIKKPVQDHTQTQKVINQNLTIRAIPSKNKNLEKKGSDTPEKIEVQCDLLLRSSEPSSELDPEENLEMPPCLSSPCKITEKNCNEKNNDDGVDRNNDLNQIVTQSIVKPPNDKETNEIAPDRKNQVSDKNNSDSLNILKNISKHLIIKSLRQSTPEISTKADENCNQDSNTCREFVLVNNKETSMMNNDESEDLSLKLTDQHVKSDETVLSGGNAINSMRKLGPQISIKSVNQPIRKPDDDVKDDEENTENYESDDTTKSMKQISKEDKIKTFDDGKTRGCTTLSKLSQQITIKSVNKSVSNDNDEELDNNLNFEKKTGSSKQDFQETKSTVTEADNALKRLSQNIVVKTVTPPITEKNIDAYDSGSDSCNEGSANVESSKPKMENIQKPSILGKLSHHITVKPKFNTKKDIPFDECDHEDNSESYEKNTQKDVKTNKEIDLLKSLGNNITIKSPKTVTTKEVQCEDDIWEKDCKKVELIKGNQTEDKEISKDLAAKQTAHALQKISQHLTVKSNRMKIMQESVSNELKTESEEMEHNSEGMRQQPAIKTFNVFKNNQLTIKSSNECNAREVEDDEKPVTETQNKSDTSEDDDDEPLQTYKNSITNMKSKMKMNIKPFIQNTSSSKNNPNIVSQVSKPSSKIMNKPILTKSSQNKDGNSYDKEDFNNASKGKDVPEMKNLSQISIKPVNSLKHMTKTRETIEEEIFSIDDSDSDETCKPESSKKELNIPQKISPQNALPAKPANILRNVRKHDMVQDGKKERTISNETDSDSYDDNADFHGSDEDDKQTTAKKNNEQTTNPSLAKLMSNKNISFKNKPCAEPKKSPILHMNQTKIENARNNDLQNGSSDEDNVPLAKPSNNNKNIKYLGKDITIKSLKETTSDDDDNFGNSDEFDDDDPFEENQSVVNKLKNINKNLSIKSNSENSHITSSKNMRTKTSTVKSQTRVLKREASESFSQDAGLAGEHSKRVRIIEEDTSETAATPAKTIALIAHRPDAQSQVRKQQIAASNSMNQEVTTSVKTIQTSTVVQEITTTVTRTIKTVNQSMTQEVSSSGNQILSNMAIRGPNIVQGMRVPLQGRNYQGMSVRHVGPRVRQMTPTRPSRPTINTAIRQSNTIPSVRQPGVRQVRPSNPRMPRMQTTQSRPQNPTVRNTLNAAPRVLQQQAKRSRPYEDESDGCFKIPKQIISSNVNMAGDTAQVASSSFVRSHSSSTIKTVKSNDTMTATQTKSEVHSAQKQISRVGNLSGVKVVQSQSKSSESRQVVKQIQKSEASRSTLDAIERLRKQGLLVKKPIVEEPPEDEEPFEEDHTDSEFEDDEHDNTLLAIESGR